MLHHDHTHPPISNLVAKNAEPIVVKGKSYWRWHKAHLLSQRTQRDLSNKIQKESITTTKKLKQVIIMNGCSPCDM